MRDVVAALLLTSCGGPTAVDTDSDATHHTDGHSDVAPYDGPPNVLIVLLDDVGVDAVSTYGLQPKAADTPTLDRLAAEGTRFTHAWAMPICTPTRAALLTGRLPRRTGMGTGVSAQGDESGLPLGEVTIAELLRDAPTPYTSHAIGKWHVSSEAEGGPDAPRQQGFDHHRGALGNLLPGQTSTGESPSYERWEEAVDGVLAWRTGNVITAEVDDALAAIDAQPQPWLVYLAMHAAHEPFLPAGLGDSERRQYLNTVEAADAELGRLLDALGDTLDHTLVVVMGDNGSPASSVVAPFDRDRAKGTLFEGGIRVPMLVRWPGVAVAGSVSDALVSVVDVFPTVAVAAGVDAPTDLDGIDLSAVLRDPTAGVRDIVISEQFGPNGFGEPLLDQVVARDARWKLARSPQSGTYLFDLQGRDLEDANAVDPSSSPEATEAATRLGAALDAHLGVSGTP